MSKLLPVVMIIVGIYSVSFAQEETDGWKFTGQLQIRSEVDGRDFSNKTHPLTFASMRTRLGVEKSFFNKIDLMVQFQDSRVFGKEPNTLADISNVDIHQAYVKLKNIFELPFDIQAGRFEVKYGTERFFGAVGWHYVGRSWDGVRASFTGNLNLDIFALTENETVSYIANAVPSIYPYPAKPSPSTSVYGFWGSSGITKINEIDYFGYYHINREKIGGKNVWEVVTLGLDYFGSFGKFSPTVEAAYQTGNAAGVKVSAYLVSVKGAYAVDELNAGAGADLLSGTSEKDSKIHTFSPSFGTNHKFYGYMDYFINIPANTYGLGLNDFYIFADYIPDNCKFSASAVLHNFITDKVAERLNSNGELKNMNDLGQELDLTVKYQFIKGTSILWGGSVFFPGDLMKSIFLTPNYVREDPAFWTYVMITANL